MLSIALATRQRPSLLAKTLALTMPNVSRDDTRLTILADEDDLETIRFIEYFKKSPFAVERKGQIVFSVAPREDTLGEKTNRVMSVTVGDVYVFMGDYRPLTSYGFDQIVLDAAAVHPDGFTYVHGNLANLSFPSLQAVTHRLAVAMGGIYPGYFPFWFVDHWLDDVGEMIGRISYADVESDGSKRPNKTHEMRDVGFWAAFYDVLFEEREAIARSIIERLDETEHRKKALINNFPIVRQRSFLLNSNVRESAEEIEKNRNSLPPDERYLRVKEAAIRKFATIKAQQEN